MNLKRIALLMPAALLALGLYQWTYSKVRAAPPTNKKRILVIGQTKGFEHDSISAAMAAVYSLGQESGLWDATLRTDTELLTKKDLGRNAKRAREYRRKQK